MKQKSAKGAWLGLLGSLLLATSLSDQGIDDPLAAPETQVVIPAWKTAGGRFGVVSAADGFKSARDIGPGEVTLKKGEWLCYQFRPRPRIIAPHC